MSAPYEVTAANRVHTVVDDRTTVTVAAVVGRLVDEGTGAPLPSPARLRVASAGLAARVLDGAWFAVSAVPALDLPLLASDAYTVVVTASAAGFEDRTVTFALPAGTALPHDAGEVTLRRARLAIAGRLTHAATGAPLAGALVFASAPAAAQQLVATRWPLRLDHAAGVAVRRRQLAAGPAVTALEAEARGGDRAIRVGQRSGLASGTVLRLGTGDRVETAVVDSVAAEPANMALPGDVTLTAPLWQGFPAAAPVQELVPGAVSDTRALTHPARAGDGLLRVDGPLDPGAVDTLEVDDPGSREYHLIGAVCDADGFYRLDGVGGVDEARLVGRAAGLTDSVRPLTLGTGPGTQLVNLRLEP